MTIKKSLTILTTAAMMAAASMTYAQQPSAKEDAAVQTAVSQVRVKGRIEKTVDGVTLSDGDAVYTLKGEKDLSAYLGKIVLVIGEGTSSDQGMQIMVEQIVEVE